MRLRWAGLALVLLSAAAYLLLLRPTDREVATLQAEFARARVSRETTRRKLATVETERQRSGASSDDPVALALSLRPGLLACLERSGLRSAEFSFTGTSASTLRLRATALGDLSGALDALDCAVSAQSGIVPAQVTLSRVPTGLRLDLAGSPGEVPMPPTLPRGSLSRDPFGDENVALNARTRRTNEPAPSTPDRAAVGGPASPRDEPAVRLVGILRRGGKLHAALSVRGEVVVAAVGESPAGYSVVSIDPSSGVVIADPSGERIRLQLPD